MYPANRSKSFTCSFLVASSQSIYPIYPAKYFESARKNVFTATTQASISFIIFLQLNYLIIKALEQHFPVIPTLLPCLHTLAECEHGSLSGLISIINVIVFMATSVNSTGIAFAILSFTFIYLFFCHLT